MNKIELHKKISNYIEENPIKFDWDRNAGITKGDIETIINDGYVAFSQDLYEINLGYIFSLEDSYSEHLLYMFSDELKECDGCVATKKYIEDNFQEEYILEDFVKKLLVNVDVNCLIYVYSNYDCCNSFDEFGKETYLGEVYKRVKRGVKKADYMWEFENGTYGGAMFAFAYTTNAYNAVKQKLKIKELEKTGKIFIPKGTQFGFFSSGHGASSPFEKETYRDMAIPILENRYPECCEYDCVGITIDQEQSYSLSDVFGKIEFNSMEIEIKE